MLHLVPEDHLAARLIRAGEADWKAYTEHPFVQQLGAGTLPRDCFRHYLVQDYLFLVHFARAWSLLAVKSESVEDIREAAATVQALIGEEIKLHIAYCAEFGISEADITAAPEARATILYTRYVMERGLTGDALDLLIALSPCVIGYGEIARSIRHGATDANPYKAWIEMYAGEDTSVVTANLAHIERAATRRLGPNASEDHPRFADLAKTFAVACKLEADFWQMGMDLAD